MGCAAAGGRQEVADLLASEEVAVAAHAVRQASFQACHLQVARLRVRAVERRAVSGRTDGDAQVPAEVEQRLAAEAERHADATVSRSLEQNSRHFMEARERLEKWADDMVLAAEKALRDTKEQIKALRRDARQAETLEAQHEIQQKMQKLERQQRHQRQDIFRVEDEIMAKRDALIGELERRLAQRTQTERLFTVRWQAA